MTMMHFRLADPSGIPLDGYVSLVPTRRVTVGDEIRLPTAVRVPLQDGEATVDMLPSTTQWVWRVAELVKGGITRYVAVPDTDTVVEYAALESVDPASLDVSSASVSAWEIATRTAQETLDKVGEIDGKVERAEDAAAGAESSASEAESHETAARSSADAAASSASGAASSAGEASGSAEAAAGSATAAALSASDAAAHAESAGSSADAAAMSATTAASSATEAAESVSAAASHATAAAQSASEASASASAAKTSETNAASSASTAKVSETNAADSATAAQNAVNGFGLEVGTTTTGEPGTDAEVEIVKNGTKYKANFTIPRGADGTSGSGGSGGGLSSVTHDSTLLGDGTSSNPLKLAKGTILTLNAVDRNTDNGKTFDLNDLLEGFTRVVGLKKNLLNLPNLDYVPGNYATGLVLTTTIGSGNKIQLWFDAKTSKGKIHIRTYVQPNWTPWNATSMQSDLNNYVPLSTYQALETRVQALEAKLANQ